MLSIGFKSVLLISPHTDDCEFGLGGTIARMVEGGTQITWVICSNAVKSLADGFGTQTLIEEQCAAAETLGIPRENLIFWDFEVREFPAARQEILEKLVALGSTTQFDAVFCPSQNDWHQDHMTISQECRRAFKRTTLLGYDLPWNNFTTEHSLLVRIEPKHLEIKLAALACYKSQAGRPYMQPQLIESIARVRAIPLGEGIAEAFEVIRMVS